MWVEECSIWLVVCKGRLCEACCDVRHPRTLLGRHTTTYYYPRASQPRALRARLSQEHAGNSMLLQSKRLRC